MYQQNYNLAKMFVSPRYPKKQSKGTSLNTFSMKVGEEEISHVGRLMHGIYACIHFDDFDLDPLVWFPDGGI